MPQIRRQALSQHHRFFDTPFLSGQNPEQAAHRVHVLGLAGKNLLVQDFGVIEAVQLGHDVGERAAHRRLEGAFGLQRQRLAQAGFCSLGITLATLGLGQADLLPEACSFQRFGPLPGLLGGNLYRLLQQLAGIRKTLLTQAHDAQAGQPLFIGRPFLDDLAELHRSRLQVTGIQGFVCPAQCGNAWVGRVHTAHFTGNYQTVVAALDFVVVSVAADVGLVVAIIAGLGVEPDQRLAPGLLHGLGHRRLVGYFGQAADAAAPAFFAIGQVLAQRQLVERFVGVILDKRLDAAASGFPAVGGAGQGLVILKAQATIGYLVAEYVLISLDGFLITPLSRQASWHGQAFLIKGALAYGAFDAADFRMIGARLAQSIQIHLGGGWAVAACFGVGQPGQRGGAVGVCA